MLRSYQHKHKKHQKFTSIDSHLICGSRKPDFFVFKEITKPIRDDNDKSEQKKENLGKKTSTE